MVLLFIIVKIEKELKGLSTNEWIKKKIHTHIYIYNVMLFSHEKEGNSVICDNVDEPGGHYAK